MFSYIWPIALAVLSNVVYHISSKSTPADLDPFASLTVTYLIGAAASLILFFVFNRNSGTAIFREYAKLNWAPFALGIVIVGLEAGFMYAYRAGWQVSTASLVQSSILAILLIFAGAVLYREQITWNKILGMIVCLGGLVLINLR